MDGNNPIGSEVVLSRLPAGMTGTKVSAPALPYVEIYTDGGCEPNPGAGGYGVVLVHPKTRQRKEAKGGFRLTTNNRMEIYAAIRGLELLKHPCRVVIFSDSQYVVKAIMHGWAARWRQKDWWRTKSERAVNVDLWIRLLRLCEIHQVEFRWIKGHAGHSENERCDQLSSAALRAPNLPADEGYENEQSPARSASLLNHPGLSRAEPSSGRSTPEL